MWEITLIGQDSDYLHFVLLKDKLNAILDERPTIAISQTNNLLFSVAINNKKDIKQAKKCILETIIKICKEEYYRETMISLLGNNNKLNDFILLSLVSSNIQDEVDYAMVKIKFSKILHIRSLVKFRLNRLYIVWERFVQYFKNKIDRNFQERLYVEFLKFIAVNNINNNEIMYLEENTENMLILDKDKKILTLVPKNDEIGVVVNLIVLSPKKLIINCYNKLSNKIATLIEYIFQDRISFLL